MNQKGKPLCQTLRLLLFFGMLLVYTGSIGAQSKKTVTLNFPDAPFTEVINELKRQTGKQFLFNVENVKGKRSKNLTLKNVPVEKAIAQVIKHFGLTYSVVKGVIVINDAKVSTTTSPQVGTRGQIIAGKVVDEDDIPLPGVSVQLDGTRTEGCLTDLNGDFYIETTASRPRTVIFSMIGMDSETRVFDHSGTVRVVLRSSQTELDQVVVTGYQTMDRRDMVGSYTSLKADDIMMPAYTSIDQMLQGRVAGMLVTNTSSRVGTSPKITIRGKSTILGNSDPLWVVDGIIQPDPIPIDVSSAIVGDLQTIIGNQISWLNPNDIENITVLKDASATAVYGAKASNGVIVITTKKGQSDRTSIRYSTNLSFKARPNYDMFDFMNSKERIQFSKEAYDAGARYQTEPLPQIYTYEGLMEMLNKRLISEEDFERRMKLLETVNTDWFDILTENAISHNHNLSVSGRTNKLSYTASLGYSKNNGNEIGNSQEQINARLNIGAELFKNVRMDFSINTSFSTSNGFSGGVNPMNYATNTSRAIPAYENGDRVFYKQYQKYSLNSAEQELSYNILNERENSYSQNKNAMTSASLNISWKILPSLTYQFVGGLSRTSNTSEAFVGERTNYIAVNYRGYDFGQEETNSEKFRAAMLPFGGELMTNNMNGESYNMQNKLLYSQTFNEDHRLNVMLAMEVRSVKSKAGANTVYGYVPERGELAMQPTPLDKLEPIGVVQYRDWGILTNLYQGGWRNTNTTNNYVGYFGTLAYSIKNRYVLNANIRADASNRFGQDVNKQFDPTYSFGVSWRMAEENFIKNNISWLNQLNLRATFGIQGNVVTSISPELIVKQQGILPSYNEYSLSITSLPNPHLKWERTKTWDFGLDLQLFNGVTMSMQYYNRRSNAIISVDIAHEYGRKEMKLNGGRITNSGLEFTMNVTPYRRKDFAWTVGFNASKNWNKSQASDLTAFADKLTRGDYLNGVSNRPIKKGYPLSAFWSYSYSGLSAETGYPMFNYLDFEEGVVNLNLDPVTYLVYSGESVPFFTGGFNTSIRYKSLTVSTSFSVQLGGKKRLPNPYSRFSYGKIPDPFYNLPRDLNDRWKKPGDELHTDIPAIYTSVIGSDFNVNFPEGGISSIYEIWAMSDERVVSSSFLRCTQLSLSWNMPAEICRKFGATSFSASFNTNNLFVVASKRFKGFDPELGNSVMPRIYSVGFNVGF